MNRKKKSKKKLTFLLLRNAHITGGRAADVTKSSIKKTKGKNVRTIVKNTRSSSFLRIAHTKERRDVALVTEFRRHKGRRIFVMTAIFPFVAIGKIVEVKSEYVCIQVENAQVSEIEGKNYCIRIDSIQAFYIEKSGVKRIPQLKDLHN